MSDEIDRYVCTECGYIYDPAEGDTKGGIPPGISFANLPAHWVCLECGADKDKFVKIQD